LPFVTPCIRVRHYGPVHRSVHVHMVYSVRAKLAVRITARFAAPRPVCPATGPPTAAYSGRPVLRCPPAPGGGLALFVPEAGAGWPDGVRAISSRLRRGADRMCVADHRDGRPAGRHGERYCARIMTPRRAAASMQQGVPDVPGQSTGSGGAGHVPVVDWCWTCHVHAVYLLAGVPVQSG
jgi:hypothetical protein